MLQVIRLLCRRLVYYPQSDWDATQFAIYLTPMASQQSRVGWLRQVSFNVRVHGHDSPSQSIWASEFVKPAENCPFQEINHQPVPGVCSGKALFFSLLLKGAFMSHRRRAEEVACHALREFAVMRRNALHDPWLMCRLESYVLCH